MPFRERFDCLWCGTRHAVRGPGDLEGWAQLCPECLGKAGSNAFLRARLRSALAERGGSGATTATAAGIPVAPRPAATDEAARAGAPRASAPSPASASPATASTATAKSAAANPAAASPAPASVATSARRPARPPAAAFPDDWFLRRGAYERGSIHDAAWAAELDVVTRWLDGLPLGGRIDEPAAGTGFFSPLLAEKGELHASDEDSPALDAARDRLVAHRLRAHLHVADPWTTPDEGRADAVVASFLTGRVRGAGLDAGLASMRRRLRSGGLLALIDLLPDAGGGPPAGIPWTWHDAAVLEAAIVRAGFLDITVTRTGRFFLLVSAHAT